MATIEDALAFAWKLFEAQELARAREVYRKIVETDPSVTRAWFVLGVIDQVQERTVEAVASYRRALDLDPRHVEALNNLGVALHAQGKVDEALDFLRRALAVKPDYADAVSNLANVLQEQGRLDEAVASYHRAIELSPTHFDALHNLGNALRALGRLAESEAFYDRALQLKPDHPTARLSRAHCLLHREDYKRGWTEYEWRFRCKEFSIPAFRQPVWDGSALAGRPILLYCDHGMGDSIQSVRFAPMVQARGGRVILTCRRPLARLLATCRGVDQVVPEGALLPDFAVYAPLMSLPRIFETTADTIPAEVPYLHADVPLVESWRRELGLGGGLKVGIAWQGNPGHGRDRQRSFRLAQLEPLARVPGVRFVSLQVGVGVEQINDLRGRFPVTDLGGRLTDFMDSAAVIRNLDLVITADSSVAHLAGAMGAPTWVAIPFAPDWRWLTGRDDSHWYPTIRLFRQRRWGDWDDVFERMAVALAATIEKESLGDRQNRLEELK